MGIQISNLGYLNFKYNKESDKIDECHYLFRVFLKNLSIQLNALELPLN
jgi:hypothetical protein